MQRNGITLPPIVVRPDKQDEYLHYLGAGDGSGPGINFAPLGEILDMESIYKDTSRNIAQVIEHELAEVRAAGDQSVLPPLDALAREMRFRDSLIARKFGALLVAKDVAIERFGHMNAFCSASHWQICCPVNCLIWTGWQAKEHD